jgi:thiosulfate/3-mercaptopyruvate sulfurtransferase
MIHPLIGADALAGAIADGTMRVADVRWYLADPDGGHAAYRSGHLPGAVFVSLDDDLSSHPGPGRHPLPTREAFASTMGRLGLGDDHLIVAYDDRGGAIASRLWWMLRDIGHEAAAVLDGGIQGWLATGRPLETVIPAPAPAHLSVLPSLTRSIDRAALAERLGKVILIDARAGERYRGEVEPVDPVAGHIPTAHNVPQTENLATDLRFLPPRMLSARYQDVGVSRIGDTVVYCGSGVTACHDILAITVAGLPEPMLYPGSWSDWSTAGMPVETGTEDSGYPLPATSHQQEATSRDD